MVQFALAAVTASGAGNDVKIVSFNGTPSVLKMIQDGTPVAMNVGENPEWLAYANMDQALRILAGEDPVSSEHTPARVFTKDNVDDAGTPPELGKGYGDAYIAGYEKLWGLQ
jgi:ribose transport system substrate-binding protein